MLRSVLLPFATLFLLLAPVGAYAQSTSPAVTEALQAALSWAQDGDPAAALAMMLDLRGSLPGDDGGAVQGQIDHAVITLYAGIFAEAALEHEQALAFFLEAATRFRALGEGFLPAAVVALERAGGTLYQLERKREAYDLLVEARALRIQEGHVVDAGAIQALRAAGTIAVELGETEFVAREALAAANLAFSPAVADLALESAQAAALAAELSSWLGSYPLADLLADTVAGHAATIAFSLWSEPPANSDRNQLCRELSNLVRTMAGLRIDYGNYGGAHALFTFTAPVIADPLACGDHLPADDALWTNTLMARLFLRTGDPFSAHLRLRGYEEAVADAGLSDAEFAVGSAIASTRQAEARLALGFPGEAAELLAQVGDALRDERSPVFERERLLAVSLQAQMQADWPAALGSLDLAQSFAKSREPLNWFPRAEVAFRRALIQIARGDLAEARASRQAFENELADIIALQREAGRELDRLLSETLADSQAEALGDDAAAELAAARAEGRFETPAFRELDKMRLLFDLALAGQEGDAAAARSAWQKLPDIGLPGGTGMTAHAQRAYLLACLVMQGPNLECSLAIRSAFDHPASVPYACVGGCAWIENEAEPLLVGADMFRRGPLLSAFAEPVLASLVDAADAAAGRDGSQGSSALASDPAFARSSGRWAGADLAFEMIQYMIEGGAASAVDQIGARLAGGAGEVADLMRERQQIGARIDGLFRGTAAPEGEMQRLAARLNELSARLLELRPDHETLFAPEPMSVEDISTFLPGNGAFVLLASTREATYGFAVKDGELDWHRAALGSTDLEGKVATLRDALDPEAADRGATPLTGERAPRRRGFDRMLAYELYRDVIDPLSALTDDSELHLVVDGPLAALPLSVLVRSTPQGDDRDPEALRRTDWLARAHALTLLPSPAALRLAQLQRQRPRAELPFIGYGDPVFSSRDGDTAPFGGLASLPGTRREVRLLADVLRADDASIHLGQTATKAAILADDLSRARVLAFATHGLLAGQLPGASEPGLVFTHPRSGAGAEESYLTASEAATLDINADWVLLSACNTAGPDGRPDSSGLSGLARAFLFAGARSVLVSYWPVRDDAAMLLTTEALTWQMRNPAASRAAALQHAMETLLARDGTPDFAHPSAWAPFVILGDG